MIEISNMKLAEIIINIRTNSKYENLDNISIVSNILGFTIDVANTICKSANINPKAFTVDINQIKEVNIRKGTLGTYYYFSSKLYGISNIRNRWLKISSADDVNDIFENSCIQNTNTEAFQSRDTNKFISFSRYWDSSLMWGHYADKYKGLCLGYKIESGFKHMNRALINYSDYNLNLIPKATSSGGDELYKSLSYKSKDWEYEHEFRIMNPNSVYDIGTEQSFMKLDDSIILSEIYIGPKSSLKVQELHKLLNDIDYPNNVIIYSTRKSSTHFLLEINDMKEYSRQ